MTYLLDTLALLWFVIGDLRMSVAARAAIKSAALDAFGVVRVW